MAKKTKFKLPKRLAGIKIPKKVRKGPLADFIASQSGQALVAEALMLAAGALAVKKAADPDTALGDAVRHPGDGAKKVKRKVQNAGGDTGEATSRLGHAFAEATRTFRDSLQDQAPAWPDVSESAPLAEPAKKKSKPSAPGATPH